ncbi:MAG: universal stress protein UspA [Methanobacterium sp. BRmetb2]|jgi:nucleotide-binding universal stress UspA family protein|nr:MAG: universal stress protein UspA [Methanobacterium sp. BRmetb2]
MFETILVPTDGSKFASKAEDVAIELAKKVDAKIVAVYVIDEKLIYPYSVLEEEGNNILKNVREKGEKEGVPVEEILIVGNPVHDMNKIAKKSNADTIVIGTHGRSGLEKLLMGSVAESTIKSTDIPVLLVKK